ASQVAAYYNVDVSQGLSEAEAAQARNKYGRNELEPEQSTPLWKLILKQFDDLLVKILMAAAAVDFVIAMTEGDSILSGLVEPMVIMLILVANATVGVVTERNAETAIEELRAYEAEVASVLRGGQLCRLAAAELVPGDIVEVVVGGKVPADLRLAHIYSSVLKVDQVGQADPPPGGGRGGGAGGQGGGGEGGGGGKEGRGRRGRLGHGEDCIPQYS
ncbi:hypothetical protein V8C86DRAFT_1800692, partial [Haematococcus lacustris]